MRRVLFWLGVLGVFAVAVVQGYAAPAPGTSDEGI
jgi:hypothetical protein